jgi:D-beta-D-heptose 7-phosphate kinase / D-beta-D-heptose 1-phosphate adenosyltransferase
MSTQLIELVEGMTAAKVVLVGDFMVDRYLFGNAERLSPEAPVPVLHFQSEEHRLGGAGNVAAMLAGLGAEIKCVGVLGRDEMGGKMRELLRAAKVEEAGMVEAAGRPTVCKMRLVGSAQHRHPQQMIRLDFENSAPVDSATEGKLLESLKIAMDGAADRASPLPGMLLIEDYNKGVMTESLTRKAIAMAREKGVAVLVDPAGISDYSKYAGASALKLNRPEAGKASGVSCEGEAGCRGAAEVLLKKLDLEAVIITLDKEGAYLATRDGERRRFATKPRQVFDVTGAGDMVLAALAVARSAGASWAEAVAISNVAGGLEVEKFGTVPVKREEILQELLAEARETLGKERSVQQLVAELSRQRAMGKKIVFTNGCFDLIHLGHVKYFQFAKAQGDLLVVGVNTDESIRRLKGPKRPVVNEEDRVGVLEELESIDYVVRFGDDTPADLIKKVRPDVLVKGADYQKEQVVGWDFVESYGGCVALAPLIGGRSTSSLITRIVEAHT